MKEDTAHPHPEAVTQGEDAAAPVPGKAHSAIHQPAATGTEHWKAGNPGETVSACQDC